MPCAIVSLCHFVFLYCVLAYWLGPDLEPVVFVIVHIPWPISEGLDHPFLHVYARLLPCFILVLASLVLGFATLDALGGFVVVWLHPTPMRPRLGVTTWDTSLDTGLLCACLFPLRAMICLPCLFVPPVGFLCIFTRLLTCPCMSLAC